MKTIQSKLSIFMNPLDVADYLTKAQITLQTAFGMTYVENFLGLGTVIFDSKVPKGTIYATAKDNIVLYYIPVNGADLGEAFEPIIFLGGRFTIAIAVLPTSSSGS